MYDKTKYIYVGLDLHKEQHTAVIMDCFNEKLGEITFQNKPSEFGKLITKCKKYCTDGKGIVFALENSYGYGRALAAWLIERNYIVKDVNPALSYAYRKSVPQYKKNDSYDAQCVARVAINELNKLPDAMPEDMYWTLSQLVNRRANLKTHHIRLKNQLQEQVCVAYPSYKQFFQDIGRPTALYFWEHYPSPRLLQGKTVKELAEELIPVSHNQFSTRKCQKILDAVKSDGDTTRDYQPERDEITRGLVRDVRHYVTQLEEVDKAITDFLPRFECTLNTIPGVSDTTVAKLLSGIGDIRRFPNADKLANFAGIAPVNFSSAGKGEDKSSKQGNRRLQGTIYFLAIQMIQLSSKGLPRNPAFYAYYQRQLARGKTKPQALILISRRLISIIYGMLKNKTEYQMPEVQKIHD
ncbi:MAG: IS110 family transposase [Lachnospiraceae bacterium]|nr:IS110 family transposase [Lachnospiraceae bacterium]